MLIEGPETRALSETRARGETDFYTLQVLGGAAFFDDSAAAVYKNPVP